MTVEQRVKVVDTISDIFLDISRYFKIEYELSYDYHLDIESQYNELMAILPEMREDDKSIFKISSKNAVIRDWDNEKKQVYLKKTTKYILNNFKVAKNRVDHFLSDYNIQHKAIVIIVTGNGLIKLPLYENDTPLQNEDRIRMGRLNYTSYEKDMIEIDRVQQISHVYISISISDKSIAKKKIKRFKFF